MQHQSDSITGTPTVNVVNLLRVADAIEKHEIVGLGFNMYDYGRKGLKDLSGHSCGTSACIAGWAVVLAGCSLENILDSPNVFTEAKIYFGLSDSDAVDLFISNTSERVTPIVAARTLRHFALTGGCEGVVWQYDPA